MIKWRNKRLFCIEYSQHTSEWSFFLIHWTLSFVLETMRVGRSAMTLMALALLKICGAMNLLSDKQTSMSIQVWTWHCYTRIIDWWYTINVIAPENENMGHLKYVRWYFLLSKNVELYIKSGEWVCISRKMVYIYIYEE